ncbi:hypothetical protein SPHINGOAX6_40026 [Sphingomonas sp. AX6]|nr:hypothetical protein SPHINGOAX6_40026 [Sphingomonas sp. AX6]
MRSIRAARFACRCASSIRKPVPSWKTHVRHANRASLAVIVVHAVTVAIAVIVARVAMAAIGAIAVRVVKAAVTVAHAATVLRALKSAMTMAAISACRRSSPRIDRTDPFSCVIGKGACFQAPFSLRC